MSDSDLFDSLHLSGTSEVLKEQFEGGGRALPYHGESLSGLNLFPPIELTSTGPSRWLSIDEQRVLQRALRRSVKVVHKALSLR